jgi:hypothetical protein
MAPKRVDENPPLAPPPFPVTVPSHHRCCAIENNGGRCTNAASCRLGGAVGGLAELATHSGSSSSRGRVARSLIMQPCRAQRSFNDITLRLKSTKKT